MIRSCKLRNTPWVVGICVYTGLDTKQMRNSEKKKSKMSKIEKETN